jgi:hypothetical protein
VSEKIPGGTMLVQEDDISGILSFLFKPNYKKGKRARKAINKFNIDIKMRVELL